MKTAEDMKAWIDAITKAAKGSEPGPSTPSKLSTSTTNLSPPGRTGRTETISASMEAVPIGNNSDLYQMKFSFEGRLSHKNMLAEPKYANVAIQFPNGKTLIAHDYILAVRCQKLSEIVESKKHKKKRITVVDWKDLEAEAKEPYEAFVHLLPCIYLDEVNLTDMNLQLAVDVTSLAQRFDVKRLQYATEKWIEGQINMGNVHSVLHHAHDLKLESVKSISLAFAFKRLKEFVGNKEETNKLGMDLFHEVVTLQTETDPEFYKIPEIPESQHIKDYKNLYINLQTDPNAGDSYVEVQNEVMRFHKAVLEVWLSLFGSYTVVAALYLALTVF